MRRKGIYTLKVLAVLKIRLWWWFGHCCTRDYFYSLAGERYSCILVTSGKFHLKILHRGPILSSILSLKIFSQVIRAGQR